VCVCVCVHLAVDHHVVRRCVVTANRDDSSILVFIYFIYTAAFR
jgi:hypothetical protein